MALDWWTKLRVKVGGITIFFGIVIFLISSYYTIEWVPNEHFANVTDENNVTTEVVQLHYARGDLVPVKTFGENNLNHWRFTQVFIILGIFAIYVYASMVEKERVLMPEEECKDIVKKKLSLRPDISRFTVHEQTILEEVKVDEGEKKPTSRAVITEVEFDESVGDNAGSAYLAYILNPYTGYVKHIAQLAHFPTFADLKNPQTGLFPDLKVITPEGYKIMKEKFKD